MSPGQKQAYWQGYRRGYLVGCKRDQTDKLETDAVNMRAKLLELEVAKSQLAKVEALYLLICKKSEKKG